MEEQDGPRMLELESGVVRLETMLGVEWMPGMIAAGSTLLMLGLALYGQPKMLYGLWLSGVWYLIAVLMYRRDPQYWEIMWTKEWYDPWPSSLYPAPSVTAPVVALPPSSLVRE